MPSKQIIHDSDSKFGYYVNTDDGMALLALKFYNFLFPSHAEDL